uniref:Uncharacterized protein n=1 Tax=Neobacillus citreus TaxID=2833578 RepID=A0A942YBF0_9BACI
MPNLNDTLAETQRYWAWTGAVSDLSPIFETIEKQYGGLRADWITQETKYARDDCERAERSLERANRDLEEGRGRNSSMLDLLTERAERGKDDLEAARKRLAAAEEAAEHVDDISITVKVQRGGERSTHGRPSELVDYLRHIDVRDLTVHAPYGGYRLGHRISLYFDHEDGVTITVSSDESTWTSAAFAQIRAEVRRRVPWWRWMRSAWFLLPLMVVVSVAFLVFVGNVAISMGGVSSVVSPIVGALLVPATIGAFVAARWLLRPFELTTGDRPRGARVLYLIGGAILSVILNIISSRWS